MKYFFLLGSLLLMIIAINGCNSTSPQAPEHQGKVFKLDQNSDPQARIRTLSKQIIQNPENYALYEERSRLFYQLDRLDSALLDIDAAIKIYRNGPELHYLKGFYAYMADDTATARKELQAAIGLGSANPESFYQLGQLYFIQTKYEQAHELYEKAIETDSSQAVYHLAQALVYEKQRNYDRAEAKYLDALAVEPEFIKAMAQLHDLYLNIYKSEEKAMVYNRKLLEIDPGHPLGRFQEGSFYLRKALAVTDENDNTLFQKAINDAVGAFSVAINKDPNFIPAIYSRGYCYFMGSELAPAVQDFERIIDIDPKHVQAHFMLGSINEYYQDLDKALMHYQQVLATDPHHLDAQRAIEEIEKKRVRE